MVLRTSHTTENNKARCLNYRNGNSWRGDHFEATLRSVVNEHGLTSGARIGPFAVG